MRRRDGMQVCPLKENHIDLNLISITLDMHVESLPFQLCPFWIAT